MKDFQKSDSSTAADKGETFQGLVARIPKVPGNLSDVAREHWYYIGERLVKANMITEVDLGQFQILCETWALYLKASRLCDELGELQSTPNNYHQLAPWAVARERHANRYQKVSDKFFLSPRARKSVDIKNPAQGSLDLD
ncbi:P27 family phage terminase small subunit [Gilvimarinus agarilyticus]|uniref:P27 family phage terminase small subunit n=1 Tax=Gilvimarinus agarilyticus TaxID=679259 RepID=UPI0005A084A6|nr:P27 family phage terminase small subunit [Gilvimarinus agarilyticus]